MGVLLDARNLSKSFGGIRAVDSVGLQVASGELVGLIGPNGAGKTTLFNILTGHDRADDGDLFWRGRRINDLATHLIARQGLARTFQNPMVFGRVSVADNLMIAGSGRRGASPDGVASVAARCRLEPFLGRDAHDLPYGVKRRLGIALALMTGPAMLLADEPAAGLNDDERRDLLDLLRDLWRGGMTLVVVEHDMELVMNLCQRVIVLDAGRIIFDGSPGDARKDAEVVRVYLGPGSGAPAAGAP